MEISRPSSFSTNNLDFIKESTAFLIIASGRLNLSMSVFVNCSRSADSGELLWSSNSAIEIVFRWGGTEDPVNEYEQPAASVTAVPRTAGIK